MQNLSTVASQHPRANSPSNCWCKIPGSSNGSVGVKVPFQVHPPHPGFQENHQDVISHESVVPDTDPFSLHIALELRTLRVPSLNMILQWMRTVNAVKQKTRESTDYCIAKNFRKPGKENQN